MHKNRAGNSLLFKEDSQIIHVKPGRKYVIIAVAEEIQAAVGKKEQL